MDDSAIFRGKVLDGKYRLGDRLGQGGMGSVYRATHLGTDRVVALKLIAPGLVDQEEFLLRFQREAKAAGRLRHPSIVDLTDFGFADFEGGKLAYLVMEFLEGETLGDLLKRNPLPPLSFVVRLVQQVCSALQKAHSHGIVHRDLKPDNLWLAADGLGGHTVKILDFGLAKIYEPKAHTEGSPESVADNLATRAMSLQTTPKSRSPGSAGEDTELGTVLGTPAYMSPEQCRGVPLDHRSDLYSLGVIVYQMLSGKTPFQGSSAELIHRHIMASAPQLSQIRKSLPAGLPDLVMECLAKDPEERPANAELLGNAFEALAQGQVRLLHDSLAILLERRKEIWPRVWPLFAPPLLLLTLLFLVSRFWGEALQTWVAPILFGTGIPLAFAGITFGYGVLKGLLSPLVLHHLLFPLSQWPPSTRFLSPAQQRSYVRFVGLNSLLFFGIFQIVPTILILSNLSSLSLAAVKSVIVGLGVLAWGILIPWMLATRRYGGQAIGILPCVMFVEGLDPESAGKRLRELKKTLAKRHLKLERVARPGMSGLPVVLMTFLVLVIGKDALNAPTDLSTAAGLAGSFSFFLWFSIFIAAIWGLLAALDAITTALVYLRVRKLARESLRRAFESLRKHQESLDGVPEVS